MHLISWYAYVKLGLYRYVSDKRVGSGLRETHRLVGTIINMHTIRLGLKT